LTEDNYGCGGCGTWLWNKQTRSREDYLDFLVNNEGLKESYELMNKWLDHSQRYEPEHEYLIFGQLKENHYKYLKTVTFFVNPDQLSVLLLGANYFNSPEDPPAVIAPFGAGCMEMLPLFEDLSIPQAIIGATDMAMRKYLPSNILAFTVTKPMFERLCSLDKKSFLFKPFIQDLIKARKGSIG
jgi:hypothetical protein